jgi:hypothetical protein
VSSDAIKPAPDGTEKGDKEAVAAPSSAAPKGVPSLLFMFRFLLTDPKMRLLCPVLLFVGFGNGIFNGLWFGSVVSGSIGKEYVGFAGAAYSFASAAATHMWGKLVQRPAFGRRGAFAVAAVLHLIFFVAFGLWSAHYFPHSGPGRPAPPPLGTGVAATLAGAVLYAFGDSAWFSQLPATLQTFFPSGPEAPCAMASIRFYTALGFSVQAAVSVSLGKQRTPMAIPYQFAALCVCLLIACSCLAYLHFFVHSIDPRDSPKKKQENITDVKTKGNETA